MGTALNTILMITVALLTTGVINRTRAVLAGRKGLRFFQHLFDAKVLLGKGAVYSPTTGILFRLAPCVCLASSLAAFLFIPVADLDPLLSFDGDVVRWPIFWRCRACRLFWRLWIRAARSRVWALARGVVRGG